MSQQDALQPLTDMRLKALAAAADRYESDAMLSSDFDAWAARRGLSADTTHTFRLGVVNDPLPGHERYRGRIAIPYINANQQVVQLRFRCVEDHKCEGHPKYLGEAGDNIRLFNTRTLNNPTLDIHLAEGEIDCMILTQVGLNAVAVAGVGGFARRHLALLQGYKRVWVWGDGDEAGRDFTRAVQEDVRTAIPVNIPNGHDANSLYLQEGAEGITGRLKALQEAYA